MEAQKIQFELFGKQWDFFESKKRIRVAIAGIQGGKTTVGAITLASEMIKNPTKTFLLCAPTYKILEQSTLQKFFEVAPFYKKYYKSGLNSIKLPEGGQCFVRSTEDPNTLEGMTVDGMAWLDEGGQMKRDAYINIQGRTSIAQAPIIITTTPYTLNWLYNDVYQLFKRGINADTVECFEWQSVDNPYFPKAEFERAKAEMDVRTFKRRYMGLFEKMEGLVYEDFTLNHIIEPKVIPFKEVIAGVDWGFQNPAAIAIIGIDKENTYYLIDEYYEKNKTKAEIIERMKYYKDKYAIRMWYPDPEDAEGCEQMRREGLYPREVVKTGTKQDIEMVGIPTVRELIRKNQFRVFSTCRWAIEEFNIYHYPEYVEGKSEKERPLKEFDHLMDSIRYALMTYKPRVGNVIKESDFIVKKRKEGTAFTPQQKIATSIY